MSKLDNINLKNENLDNTVSLIQLQDSALIFHCSAIPENKRQEIITSNRLVLNDPQLIKLDKNKLHKYQSRTKLTILDHLEETILSVHLSSGGKAFEDLKHILQDIKANGTETVHIQGDFNINFLQKNDLNDFLQVLAEEEVCLLEADLAIAPIKKSRGCLINNAQLTKAYMSDIAIKDAHFKITTKTSMEGVADINKACKEKLQENLTKQKQPKQYTKDIFVDHLPVLTQLTSKHIVVHHNIISSQVEENKIYEPKNYKNLEKTSQKLNNFMFTYLLRELFENQEKVIPILKGIQHENFYKLMRLYSWSEEVQKNRIFNFEPTKKYSYMFEHGITGLDVRKMVEKYFNKAFTEIYKDSETKKEFIKNFYNQIFNSPEFENHISYLFKNTYSDEEKQKVIDGSLQDEIFEGICKMPHKMLDYFVMGGLKTEENDTRASDSFYYPLCFQINGGFDKTPFENQTEIDEAQVKDFLNYLKESLLVKGISKEEITPIDIVELSECGKDKHGSTFYDYIKKIVELSRTTPLDSINFENHIKNAVLRSMELDKSSKSKSRPQM